MIVLIKISELKFRVIKSDVRLFRYCYFKNRSILSQLTWINFWRLKFLKNQFQKSFFFQKISKNREKNFRKKIWKRFFEKKLPKILKKVYLWKKNFILQDFCKLLFRKSNLRKLINGRWDMINFTPNTKPYNSDVSSPNWIFQCL